MNINLSYENYYEKALDVQFGVCFKQGSNLTKILVGSRVGANPQHFCYGSADRHTMRQVEL